MSDIDDVYKTGPIFRMPSEIDRDKQLAVQLMEAWMRSQYNLKPEDVVIAYAKIFDAIFNSVGTPAQPEQRGGMVTK